MSIDACTPLCYEYAMMLMRPETSDPAVDGGPLSGQLRQSRAAGAGGEERHSTASSLHGELLTRLRDYVVEGDLPAGARIPERLLCERFGISRTPLREALKVLASEGLIDLLPNRGARVRQIGERELADLFDIMGGLEALAGRLACERITDQAYTAIENLHHAMYLHYLRRDLHGYFACNQAIHEAIVAAADNETLGATYKTFTGRLRRARFSANLDKYRDRWSEAMREHEAILDALRRRASSELSDILFLHLRNKYRAVVHHETEIRKASTTAGD
jgi:DNA-binding GntR family transcriptional regulator